MKRKLNLNIGIIAISLFYIFGAFLLILSMVTNYADVAEQITLRHGLPLDLKFIVLPAIAILAILISYGLYSHSRWGYILTLIYEIYFGLVSLILFISSTGGNLTYIGSFIWALLVVIYLLLKRRIFFHPKIVRQEIPA